MDDLKERRKSVKSRRRSLRNLQPADIGGFAVDQAESHFDTSLVSQPMYGSIWIEQSDSPVCVRKPRRSVSCSQTPFDLVSTVNKKNVYEKENFSPNLSALKMVEDMPKRMPVLCSAKGLNSPRGNRSVEDDQNQENSYEEIGVPRFEHGTQDGPVSEELLLRTISNLCLDVTDLQCQDEEVNQSVEDELQLLSDSFSEEEQNKISTDKMPPLETEGASDSLAELVASFVEENSAEPPPDSLHSCSKSPCSGDYESFLPGSPVEAWISKDGSIDFSGEKSSNVPNKDSPTFSASLCQDFRHLDISSNDVGAESDSETTTMKESDPESLSENTLDPLLESDNSSLLDNSSLDQCCSLPSDSWCFIKCYSDESSNVSALIDSSVSDGCDIWETDVSSAGSELSDSWCFSRYLNTVGHFNSTPCKTESPLARQVNNQCVEPVKHLNFTAGEEIMTEHETSVPVGISSSGCLTMELHTGPPEVGVQKLPAIECLSLEESSTVSNEECRIQAQENSHVEGPELFVTSNDDPTEDEFARPPPQKTLHKKTSQQVSDSKTKKVKPSLNGVFPSAERKWTDNSAKCPSRQPPTCATMTGHGSRDLERKSTSTKTKRQATANIKRPPNDKVKTAINDNNLKSPMEGNTRGKKALVLGMKPLDVQFSKSEMIPCNAIGSSSKQKSQPKAVSPDIIIVDSLKTTPQTHTATVTTPLKSKIPVFDSVSKSAKPVSAEKQKALKESSGLLQVKTSSRGGNLKRSFSRTGQQVGGNLVPDGEVKGDVTEPSLELKRGQIKENPVSVSKQVSSKPTSAAKTKRKSVDSLATSTVTVRRLNTKTRLKSSDVTCVADTSIGVVSAKEKTTKALSSKAEKLRRRTLVVPALEMNEVTVVDLEPLASTSSGNDRSSPEDIFDKQVTTRTKRRCQSLESAFFSIENSLADTEQLTVLPAKNSTLVDHNTTGEDYKDARETNNQCGSVGLSSIFPKGNLEMVVDTSPEPRGLAQTDVKIGKVSKGKRKSRSIGSVQNGGAWESQDGTASEPVKILDGGALAQQSQTTLRRSTRRSSIELSLSSNQKQTPAAPHSSQKAAQSAAKNDDAMAVNGDKDSEDDDEHLREIYAKKPYIPFSPSKLETIFSPTKKRGGDGVFSKRKLSRMITFQPSEARLKNRRKKAMRNWPFLVEVPDADEKLHKLLNMS